MDLRRIINAFQWWVENWWFGFENFVWFGGTPLAEAVLLSVVSTDSLFHVEVVEIVVDDAFEVLLETTPKKRRVWVCCTKYFKLLSKKSRFLFLLSLLPNNFIILLGSMTPLPTITSIADNPHTSIKLSWDNCINNLLQAYIAPLCFWISFLLWNQVMPVSLILCKSCCIFGVQLETWLLVVGITSSIALAAIVFFVGVFLLCFFNLIIWIWILWWWFSFFLDWVSLLRK